MKVLQISTWKDINVYIDSVPELTKFNRLMNFVVNSRTAIQRYMKDTQEPVRLSEASDLKSFGYFQRPT